MQISKLINNNNKHTNEIYLKKALFLQNSLDFVCVFQKRFRIFVMSKVIDTGDSENLEKSRKKTKTRSLMETAIFFRIWKIKIRFRIWI